MIRLKYLISLINIRINSKQKMKAINVFYSTNMKINREDFFTFVNLSNSKKRKKILLILRKLKKKKIITN